MTHRNLENLVQKFWKKLENPVDATNGDLAVIDAMESAKKRQVWNKLGLDI